MAQTSPGATEACPLASRSSSPSGACRGSGSRLALAGSVAAAIGSILSLAGSVSTPDGSALAGSVATLVEQAGVASAATRPASSSSADGTTRRARRDSDAVPCSGGSEGRARASASARGRARASASASARGRVVRGQVAPYDATPRKLVAPPGLEPGRPCGQRILNPPRLPFRHGASCCSGSIAAQCRFGWHGACCSVHLPWPSPLESAIWKMQ